MDYETKLKEICAKDDRVIIMTAENRAAIRNFPKDLPEKFIDTGITEQTMVGAAAGLALRGRVPVIHALATFLTMRAFEFIRSDVGIAALPVKIVGGVPGFLSDGNGATHQALEDVALMRGIPSMNVFCPADDDDLVKGLEAVVTSPNPWYIRFNARKSSYTHEPFTIGKAEVVSEGRDVGILTYGTLFPEALEAKKLLEEKGFSVRLVNLRSLKPIDEAALVDTVRGTRLTVTLEDHFLTGGLYTILSEVLLRNELTAKVLPIALDNAWFKPAIFSAVLDHEGFTGPKIAQKILNKMTQLGSN
jgi:transketolase